MPVDPVTNTIRLDVDTAEGVARLVDELRALKDVRKDSQRTNLSRDLDDHLAYVAGAHPELFAKHRDEVLQFSPEEHANFYCSFDHLAVLVAGGSNESVDHLVELLEQDPGSFQLPAKLAAVGTPYALERVAEFARTYDRVREFWDLSVFVPEQGPAEYRFSPSRRAVFLRPLGFGENLHDCTHPVGLPIGEAVGDEQSLAVWHYVTLNLREVPGLPNFGIEELPLVSPRHYSNWILYLDTHSDGTVEPTHVECEDRSCDDLLSDHEVESGPPRKVELHPYDANLVYCNGHIQCTDDVVGTAGGPGIGLYPPPACSACGKLMFHILTVEHHVRDFGDGFRSLFACEDCHKAACQATGWN